MSGPVARVAAQAKVNLALRVFAPDASGYHPVETLFQRLDLHDTVMVQVTDGAKSLDCAGPTMPAEGLGPVTANLAWRAAEAFATATGWPRGWAITVDKRIPVGGGLGGGSADAGGVLRALNAMAPRPLDAAALAALGAKLGADVPFLTAENALAIGRGYGERLEAIPPLPPADITLLCSPEGVNTKAAYGWLDRRRAQAGNAIVPPLGLSRERVRAWADVADVAVNDFEPAVFAAREDLAALFRLLQATADDPELTGAFARMSGSGATLFLLTPLDGPGPHAVPDFVVTPDDGSPDAPVIVHAMTATRVEPVERLA